VPEAPAIDAITVWRDAGLLVLDKPSGLPVLADRSGGPCLWDALATTLAPAGVRPLQVHRIDKGTSGLLLVALEREVQRRLTRAFGEGEVGKGYAAVTAAPLERKGSARIDLPLARGRKSRYRVAGDREAIRRRQLGPWSHYYLPRAARLEGKKALAATTLVRTIREDGSRALLAVRPLTGRTHQIRVHLAWIGGPLLGDHLYGAPRDPAQQAPRLALHCHRLTLPPLDGRPRVFRAPLPGDVGALLPA